MPRLQRQHPRHQADREGVRAMEALGFRNFVRLPNRKIIPITKSTKLYCYQVGAMDSALGILSGSEFILNINDCEFTSRDCKIVKRKGRVYVINKKNPRFKQRQG